MRDLQGRSRVYNNDTAPGYFRFPALAAGGKIARRAAVSWQAWKYYTIPWAVIGLLVMLRIWNALPRQSPGH